MTRTRLLPITFLVLTIPLLGCSAGGKTPARVSGKLTYNGQPIKGGKMQFHTSEGIAYSAQISPDGTYTARDLPVGEMVVTIETESINPNRKAPRASGRNAAQQDRRGRMMGGQQKPPDGAGPTAAENYVKIPPKYADPKTSELKVTLTKGSQEHDFPLTD